VTLPTFDPNQGGPPSSQPDSSTPPSRRGGFGGIGSVLQDPANAAAVSACASLQPQFGGGGNGGGFGGGGFGRNPATRAAFQAYLACLADNGVTVSTTVAPSSTVPSSTVPSSTVPSNTTPSDSSPPAGPPGGRGQPAFDRNDPNFAAANAKCSVLLPARPNPGATTSVPPTTVAGG
jgi:hypothetical protein